ncbi:MAG: hypothetical protein QXJ95_08450 [Ignisphaera sp.]
MRFVFQALIPITILLIVTIPGSIYTEMPPNITIYIDGNGVAIVTITTDAIEGISSISLPIEPLEPTIEVRCDDYEIPWLLTDTLQLHLYTENRCSVTVSYIANVSIQGGVLAIDIAGGIPVKLALDPKIVLLTVPQNIASVAYENGLLTIVFTGPVTIAYTMLTEKLPTTQPTKSPVESSTPAPSTTPTTPTPLPTATPLISKPTPPPAITTSRQTIEEIRTETLQLTTIVVVGIAIVATTAISIVLLKHRDSLK